MPKRRIEFKNTMSTDKRDPEACYLRENIFTSHARGLYPATDFQAKIPSGGFPAGSRIKKIVGGLIFVDDGANVLVYSENGSGNPVLGHTITGKNFADAVDGNDGVHAFFTDNSLLRVTSGGAANIGTLPVGVNSLDIGLYDGLHYYYFVQDKIYKQLKGGTITLAFNDTSATPKLVDVHGDTIVLFFENGKDIIVNVWGKSDLDFYEKRIYIRNAVLLGGGTINGNLSIVTGIGNAGNIKERNGEIVVSIYDGEKFVRMNSIKAGDNILSHSGQAIGDEVLITAIKGNINSHNTDLYQDWVLKVRASGAIEVLFKPDPTEDSNVDAVDISYDYIVFGTEGNASPRLLTNVDTVENYDRYENFTQSKYITNFLNNPYNRHSLDGVAVVFEKLFENDAAQERLEVYFRVSERESFTLLGTVTNETVKDEVDHRQDQAVKDVAYNNDALPTDHQIIHFSKMPDGTPLPEYNEIQYMFVPKYGFSLIDAWYGYDYLERNTHE